MTIRHDWLVQLLAKLFRMAGANVTVEPRVFDQELRPDLDIIFLYCRLLVDVTVVNPASPSRTSRVQLATAKTAEAQKLARYGDLARAHESKFLAFAVGCTSDRFTQEEIGPITSNSTITIWRRCGKSTGSFPAKRELPLLVLLPLVLHN